MATDPLQGRVRQVKWPFVSRARFDLLQHNFTEIRRDLHNAAVALSARDDRYDSLLEKYHAMKLQAAVAPDPIVPRTVKEADPIIQQINVLSAGRPGLRAQMMRQLNTDRTVEMLDDAEIMQRIEMGVVIDEGLPA